MLAPSGSPAETAPAPASSASTACRAGGSRHAPCVPVQAARDAPQEFGLGLQFRVEALQILLEPFSAVDRLGPGIQVLDARRRTKPQGNPLPLEPFQQPAGSVRLCPEEDHVAPAVDLHDARDCA